MGSRVGICGGTFDPIHLAHLRASEEVAEELALDQVVFMPCASPPHKKRVQASAEHRLEMVRLAVQGHPEFAVSDLEIVRGGASRTLDTLGHLLEEDPERQLFFFLGNDQFFYLHTWHEPRLLLDMADFVVMDRPSSPRWDLLDYLQTELDPAFAPAEDGWFRLPGGKGVRQVATTLLDISSTDIKHRVASGRSISFLVPQAVEDYIKSMKLYTNAGQD
ncbi:nicotinate-nucleotide adenylyltransferase [Desulfoferula mesophila]|uniref:Probable nicotinate-nucleotide adenylyltransferase n=1 Tax=Desulfoferula mesophila TaxID=3058419 RepID=A0AAU9EHP5_9BACT|nr:putative nicotinate-nucleotide adenylyltransferase [Desulfoferula mesophilus]